MKFSIRMKIFLPVVLISVMFPMAFWLVFRQTLDAHMVFNARRDLDRLIYETDKVLREESGESLNADRMKGIMRRETGDASFFLMNDTYRVLYPKNYDARAEMALIYSRFLAENLDSGDGWETEKIFEEKTEERTYLVYYIPVETGEETQHIVLYCPIFETERILSNVSRLMLLIMAGMTAVEILLFWFVAGSISGPVRRLCEAARGIGEKKFRKVESRATVKELCELEEEINRMQEKLAQADQAEKTFFQNVSHELRTPLMSISGYAQGIQCGVLEDTAQAAGVILEESTRLTEVVDGILSLTRMDQYQYQVVAAETELNEFLQEKLSKLEGLALAGGVQLEFEAEKETAIITDKALLEKAFVNVVSNCIRYAEKRVRVQVAEDRETVRILIWDDGEGIENEDLEHLFERFYKGRGGIHGLGLAIAKSSLEYMGGKIQAENTAFGPQFEITLPQDCRSFAVDVQSDT